MKNFKIKFVLVACFSTLLLSIISCESKTKEKEENLQEAQEEVVIAKEELNEARLDSANQFLNYRKEINIRLKKNENKIAEIRAKTKLQTTAIRTKIDKEVVILSQKNENLKVEIKNQKDSLYSDWKSFKNRFNVKMDDLGKSISKTAQDNIKKN